MYGADRRLLTRHEADPVPLSVVHRDRIRVVGVSRFAYQVNDITGHGRSLVVMPARNAGRNFTHVDGSADLVLITTSRITHFSCLQYKTNLHHYPESQSGGPGLLAESSPLIFRLIVMPNLEQTVAYRLHSEKAPLWEASGHQLGSSGVRLITREVNGGAIPA